MGSSQGAALLKVWATFPPKRTSSRAKRLRNSTAIVRDAAVRIAHGWGGSGGGEGWGGRRAVGRAGGGGGRTDHGLQADLCERGSAGNSKCGPHFSLSSCLSSLARNELAHRNISQVLQHPPLQPRRKAPACCTRISKASHKSTGLQTHPTHGAATVVGSHEIVRCSGVQQRWRHHRGGGPGACQECAGGGRWRGRGLVGGKQGCRKGALPPGSA